MTTCGEPGWPPSPRPSSSWARWRRSTRPECWALADLHVAASLLERSRARKASAGGPFGGELAVPLAIALTVRALREGSVCLRLTENLDRWLPAEPADEGPDAEAILSPAELPWPDPTELSAAVSAHPLVAVGPEGPADRPLRLVGDRLYLQRYWADEQLIARQVRDRSRAMAVDAAALRSALSRLFAGDRPDDQRLAVAMAVTRASTIITGGPGTGKTTTVARLLAVLRELEPGMTFGLAAPTGKAAARLQEAVATAIDQLGRGRPRAGPAPTGGHAAPPPRHGHRIRVPIHPPRGQSAAARRGDRRRVVDGGPAHDGPAAGVGPAGRPAGPGRRRRPAGLRRRRGGLGDLVAAAPPWASPDYQHRAAEILSTACPAQARGRRGAAGGGPPYASVPLRRAARSSSAPRSGSVTWPPYWRCSPPRTRR